MSILRSQEVLRLYRNLIRYGNQLQYTNKSYYLDRVREEFRRNKGLKTTKDIQFYINVKDL